MTHTSGDLLEDIAMSVLGASVHGGPRSATPLVLEYMRDMTLDDALMLADPARPGLPAVRDAEVMRDRHRALARAVACGASDVQASAETGFSLGTIGRLKSSPAFDELVAYFHGAKDAKVLETSELRRRVGHAALEELEERLADDSVRKMMSVKELRELQRETLGERIAPLPAPAAGVGNGTTVNVSFIAPSPVPGGAGGVTIDLHAEPRDGT